MPDDRQETQEIRKLDQRLPFLQARFYRVLAPLTVRAGVTRDHLTPRAARALPVRVLRPGATWGREGETGWLFATLALDRRLPRANLFLLAEPGGEALLYADGEPYQGIDANHREVPVPPAWLRKGRVELAIEAYAGHWIPGWETNLARDPLSRGERPRGIFRRLDLAARNPNAWRLWHDAFALRDLLRTLPETSLRTARIREGLSRCLDGVDWAGGDDAFEASLEPSIRILAPLLSRPARGDAPALHVVGHSHIDVAWLWTVREVARKCGRTFSTTDRLMDEHPEYVFLQSQAALYALAKERYPGLYRRIRARVRARRWEPNGAMWVEPDTNVSSGESLVRQILQGKAFFKAELGAGCDVLWLPDAFGFNGNLPQILRGCGVPYFATHKLRWCDTNEFPHDAFRWVGIDGSEVLSFFIRHSYNAQLRPGGDGQEAWSRCRQKGTLDTLLLPAGHGDGGGGMDRTSLELARRWRDLEGAPRLRWGSVSRFFRDLDRRRARLPAWTGEMYLEFHRGTYTSQARTKRQNRKGELALRAAEIWCALLDEPRRYPAVPLRDAWRLLLRNQFHDILPGSSIREVYQESDAAYAEMFAACARARAGVARRVFLPNRPGRPPSVTLLNALSWERGGVQIVESAEALDRWRWHLPSGADAPCQKLSDGRYAVDLETSPVPSMGWLALEGRPLPRVRRAPRGGVRILGDGLDNGLLRLRWDRRGKLASVVDLRQDREVLAPGRPGNDLTLHEDIPLSWDAWDIDRFHLATGAPLAGKLDSVRGGALAAEARFTYRFGVSRIRQTLRLLAGSATIAFDTEVEWRESHKLLKVLFPTSIRAGIARFEIPYGHVERAAHDNTSWEQARFEVPAQRWIDLSEGRFGVSLLNDCKYGHAIRHGVLSTTLLKSAKAPDPAADMGRHRFTYALHVHDRPFAEGGAVREACELNAPVEAAAGSPRGGKRWSSLVSVAGDGVIVEAVKRAEDGKGLIVRLYESLGASARATLSVALPYRRWAETDLLERPVSRRRSAAEPIGLAFRPFEIKTVRLA